MAERDGRLQRVHRRGQRARAVPRPVRPSSRHRRRRPCASATAGRSRPTARSRRRRRRSAASISIEAANLDEAIDAAAKIPGAQHGSHRGPTDLGPSPPRRDRREADRRQRQLTARATGRRPPVPRGVGPRGRDAHPGPRRLRSCRGGRPGGVRRRPRDAGRVTACRTTPAPGSRPRPGTGRSTGCAGAALRREEPVARRR